jgi:hypothetical protein
MIKDDWSKFVRLWVGLCDLYGKEPKDASVALVFEILSPFPFESVAKAAGEHARTSPYAPKPADIAMRIEGTREERGQYAFNQVWTALARIGTHASVTFDDPRTHYAIEQMGGWIAMGAALEAERNKWEKEFLRLYAIAEKAGVQFGKDAPRFLIGRVNQARVRDGFPALPFRNAVTGEVLEWKLLELPEPKEIKQLTEGVLSHEA